MSEGEEMIGEDGVDLNDRKAVAEWCAERQKEFDKSEKEFREKLNSVNVDPEAVLQHDLDLSNLPDEVRDEIANGIAELERLGSELESKLQAVDKDASGGATSLDNKYMKL